MIAIGLREFAETQLIKNIPFPPGIRFHQILVLGPPGVGKSTLIQHIGGWSEEGHLDFSQDKWWLSRALVFIPRELHLYLPFQGMKESHSVYDVQFLATAPHLDFPRILIPPRNKPFLGESWRKKFVFEFLLPPPNLVYEWRKARALRGTHLVDHDISLEQVSQQLLVFWNVAKHLHRCGLQVYIREGENSPPMEIIDTMDKIQGVTHGGTTALNRGPPSNCWSNTLKEIKSTEDTEGTEKNIINEIFLRFLCVLGVLCGYLFVGNKAVHG